MAAWGPALDRVVVDLAEVSEVLAAVHAEVKDRYRRLAEEGRRKLDVPTEDMPLLALVVDELGEVARVGPGEDKAAAAERLRTLSSLAAIGRGAGCVVLAATQRPSAQLVGADLRSNLTRRVACRVSDEYAAEAILGPEGGQLAPWLLDPAAPGTAWVVSEAHPYPQLARSWWLSDDQVAAVAAAHPARRRAEFEAVT